MIILSEKFDEMHLPNTVFNSENKIIYIGNDSIFSYIDLDLDYSNNDPLFFKITCKVQKQWIDVKHDNIVKSFTKTGRIHLKTPLGWECTSLSPPQQRMSKFWIKIEILEEIDERTVMFKAVQLSVPSMTIEQSSLIDLIKSHALKNTVTHRITSLEERNHILSEEIDDLRQVIDGQQNFIMHFVNEINNLFEKMNN